MDDQPAALHTALCNLITANHIVDHYGLTDGFGHVSIRSPENPSTFYMTGGPAPAFVSNENDLAHYQIEDGSPVISGDPRSSVHPYSERFCHSGIMKKYPRVNAVIHSHSPDVIAASVSNIALKPMYHMAGFLGEHVPVFDIGETYGGTAERNMLVNTNELGEKLASMLSSPEDKMSDQDDLPDHTVVLQRGHGFCTWGESIEEAVWRAVYTQENARIQMSATDFSVVASGELKTQPLSHQEIKDCTTLCKGSTPKSWIYWSRVVECNPMYKNDLKHRIPGLSFRKTETNRMAPF